MPVEKLRKRCGFVIYSYLKDNAFTTVKSATETKKKTKEKQKLPGIKYAFVTFNKQALEDIVF